MLMKEQLEACLKEVWLAGFNAGVISRHCARNNKTIDDLWRESNVFASINRSDDSPQHHEQDKQAGKATEQAKARIARVGQRKPGAA